MKTPPNLIPEVMPIDQSNPSMAEIGCSISALIEGFDTTDIDELLHGMNHPNYLDEFLDSPDIKAFTEDLIKFSQSINFDMELLENKKD